MLASEQQLRLALQIAGMGTWDWNLRTGELKWSRELEVSYGLAPGGFGGTLDCFIAMIYPEDREHVRETLLRAARDEHGFELEFRVVRPGGDIRWRAAAGDVLRERPRRPPHMIGVSRDITGRREAEERLRETEQRYRILVEQLPLASYVENLNEESATYISPQIADLVGYTAEEWVADGSFFASVLHPEDRARVLAGFAAMHASGDSFECEYRLIARDGHVVWIHDAAVVVRDEAGKPLYTQGYMIDISEQKHSQEALQQSQQRLLEQMRRMEHQVLHDSLTGLPNRTLFYDRVEQALLRGRRGGSGFTVMLLDLDRFKEVNDTLGHQSGDLLLQEVAGRLRGTLRGSDTVARLGGDEFGVLAPELFTSAAARALADKLRGELAQPTVVGGLTVEVEASIGIAICPDHGEDVETLMRHADVSMYVSKGTHVPTVYAATYDRHSLARLALVGDLRRAIDEHQLVVHYQPQAVADTGEVHRVEALVRWRHPQHGLLRPDEFVPLAEHTGLIRALTHFVLDAALGQCRAWHDEGSQLGVAVNITYRELMDLRFCEEVAGLLAKWRIESRYLELEVTESTVMTDLPRVRGVLAGLRELGVRLAIDDFGSGPSSLGYLKRFPFDVLKIDKSFIQNMDLDIGDAAIVRAAIELGHSLGLEIVAEGVETEAARRHLQELGCDALQGYHIGRPKAVSRLHDVVPWVSPQGEQVP
jgi:diguanylate cyclase (GGDEF)-like protein/PAS domain S-box-containing protein